MFARKFLVNTPKANATNHHQPSMNTFPFLRFWQISATLLALTLADFATAQTPANSGTGDARPDAPVKPTVTGKFLGNGKNAAIKFVLVEEEEAFGDKDAVKLIFTEKDPAKSKKPSFDAMFGDLGSALVLSVDLDGKIFGCQVAHSAHKKQGFTSVGRIKMAEFKIAGGNVTGHVTTGEELDTFREKWEVDMTFSAPMPAKAHKAPAATPKQPVAETDVPVKKERKAAAGPLIPARKLPLPKDATDVEFKQIVNLIQFNSARSVEVVTKEFSANLKQQGWKDGAGSLNGKQNAILKRVQGDAKLTIMIQPATTGSVVKIFTEGLDWSGGCYTSSA